MIAVPNRHRIRSASIMAGTVVALVILGSGPGAGAQEDANAPPAAALHAGVARQSPTGLDLELRFPAMISFPGAGMGSPVIAAGWRFTSLTLTVGVGLRFGAGPAGDSTTWASLTPTVQVPLWRSGDRRDEAYFVGGAIVGWRDVRGPSQWGTSGFLGPLGLTLGATAGAGAQHFVSRNLAFGGTVGLIGAYTIPTSQPLPALPGLPFEPNFSVSLFLAATMAFVIGA